MGLALLSATGVISTKKKATSLEGLSRCQGLILRPHRESNPLRHNVLCMWRGRVNSDTFIKCSLSWRENFVSFNLEIFHDCGGRKCWTLRLTFGWFSSLDEEEEHRTWTFHTRGVPNLCGPRTLFKVTGFLLLFLSLETTCQVAASATI